MFVCRGEKRSFVSATALARGIGWLESLPTAGEPMRSCRNFAPYRRLRQALDAPNQLAE